MNFKCILLLFSFSLSLVGVSWTQSSRLNALVFNNVTKEDGLSHDHVNDVVEDEHGFIWFGTNDGLCRYDAHDKMRVFRPNNNIAGGLKSSHIMDLFVGSNNVLFIGTRQGGLTIYDIENDSWETYVHNPNDPRSISNDEVVSILEDTKGRIWIGTENGLNLFDRTTKSFTRYMLEPGMNGKLQAKAILSISEDNKGWIWVGTWDGGFYLLNINDQNNEIFFRKFTAKTDGFEGLNIWQIYQDKNNNYWLATHHGGLFLMTIPGDATHDSNHWQPDFHKYGLGDKNCAIPANFISDILQDDKGNLWLSSTNGVSTIPFEKINTQFSTNLDTTPILSFNTYTYDSGRSTSILDNVTHSLFKDKNDVVWISSRSGVSRYNDLSNQFHNYQVVNNNEVLPNSQNYFIHNNSDVWLAAGGSGLISFNPETEKSKTILQKILQNEGNVNSIYSKDRILLYIATSNGIIQYNLDDQSHAKYIFENHGPLGPMKAAITHILKDESSNLWLCSENGLIKLNLENGSFSHYLHDPLDSSSIVDNAVTQIIQSENKDLWITTYNGFSKIIKKDAQIKFKNYKASNSKGGLRSNRLTALAHLDSIIYIGSRSGLLGYNINKDEFLDFTEGNEKLVINNLNFASNTIWGSSTNNLFKFDPTTKKMYTLDEKDGISNSNYVSLSATKGPDNNLYFGHFSGFTKVDTESYKSNTSPPQVSITEIKILSKNKTEQFNTLHRNSVQIDPDHYTLEINFAALDYTRPEKIKFAYILEGFDQEWKYLDKNESAIYTNLDHGEYTFKVKASNGVGIWNEEGTSLAIKVKPSFFEKSYIQALLLFLIGLIVYLSFKIYSYRINKRNIELKNYNDVLNNEIKERNEIEKELQTTNEELKRSNSELEQFAYIASHDLQEPLRITGSFIDLLGTKYEDVLDENAFKYIDFAKGGIGRMGLLIKNLLTYSKVGGTTLDFRNYSIKDIVEEKLLDLARLIKTKNVTIDLGVLPNIKCEKNQIGMLFYNLINNAIKFNENPNPVVNISAQNSFDKDFYSFYVSDNGIGIDSKHQEKIFEIFKRLHDKDAYEGTGIGLALCKKIVSRHGGDIWIESKIGKGTTFYFTIAKNLINVSEEANTTVNAEVVSLN